MNSINPNRRKFFSYGLGALGTLGATRAIAQICGIKTAAQPLGPFFPRVGTPIDPIHEEGNPNTPIYLANDNDLTVVRGRNGVAHGQVVYVQGRVTNAECKPLTNATLIVWQASSTGRYNHTGDAENEDFIHPKTGQVIRRILDPYFQYWGKVNTDTQGNYRFKTIVPGFYPADLESQWYRPPHIHFMVSATGYPQLVTQMYFKGEQIENNEFIQELNQKDLILDNPQLTHAEREKLVVQFSPRPETGLTDGLVGQFDILLKR